MPGVLTVEEVEALDLDHWLLLVHGSFVHMIVSVICFLGCCLWAGVLIWFTTGSRWLGENADETSSVCEGDYCGTCGGAWAEGDEGERGGFV